MMKNNLKIILGLLIGVGVLIFFYGLFLMKPKPVPETLKNVTEVLNPATVYCLDNKGKLEIRKDVEGNQIGFCIFPDGSECEEWAFYKGRCRKGERFCKDLCGDGICQEIVCLAIGCPCAENLETCPRDCQRTIKILLYYYNPKKDKDETGNIKCSRDGLVAIEREIPKTQTLIEDVLNLLLKGRENLTEEEIAQGITTEYPLEGFKLKSVNLKEDGTLILEFDDPFYKTSGGSCRVGILWFQIEATAKQFPQVKEVKFLPEELFQP